MRKLYMLFAGIVLTLFTNPSNANPVTPDVANFTATVHDSARLVEFTNTSTLGNEPGARYAAWTFGDGSSAVTPPLQGTQHIYQVAGTYNVCLRIFRIRSAGDSVVTAYICKTVTIQRTCAANFERVSSASTNPLVVAFKAIPWNNYNGRVTKVCWTFGDGQDTCITYASGNTGPYTVVHHYNHPDNFEVCVSITYAEGCVAQKCRHIIVAADSCSADFERIVSSNANPLRVYFRALPQHNNNKKPSRICWYFGDGSDTCLNYPDNYTGNYVAVHNYAHAGNYQVCIHIAYYGGCEATKCHNITAGVPDSCGADFERIVSSNASPLRAYFKALPYHNNNKKPSRICWHFGDGTDTCLNYTDSASGPYVVSHDYAHAGVYEVCVRILYFGGCEATKCHNITVEAPDSCGADFERIVSSTAPPLRAYFKALPRHNNNKKPSRICWHFGDGTDTCLNYTDSFTGPYVVAHNYTHGGFYEVCVRILYFGGCEATKCHNITIGVPDSCGADFERIVASSANPLLNYFRALPFHSNNNKPSRICWRFGDGSDTCINYTAAYTGQYAVSHRYNQPGNYEVCVNILYFGGCEARKCRIIQVPPPAPGCIVHLFEIVPSITSLVRGFVAIPQSNATPPARPVRVCWYFGDGTDTCWMIPAGSILPLTIRHTYPAPGEYRACVKVLFDGGCLAEDCREIVIRGAHNICGGYMTDSLTGPRTLRFRGFSIHAPNDEVVSYRWTFGDGATGTGQDVTHEYAHSGDFNVCLYIVTRLGCETRICKTIRVPGNNEPQLHLTPNPVVSIINVDFFSTHTEQVSVRILNNNGTQVRSFSKNVTVGPNNWTHDLSNLLPGLYSFVIQSPNQLASAIFIKQ
jgi:hypothetical protein